MRSPSAATLPHAPWIRLLHKVDLSSGCPLATVRQHVELWQMPGNPDQGAYGLVRVVETRGIEPLTPALQRRCSAN